MEEDPGVVAMKEAGDTKEEVVEDIMMEAEDEEDEEDEEVEEGEKLEFPKAQTSKFN